MSAASAQLGFAAEFMLFLASVAGLGVVVRAKLLAGERAGQVFLALGFIGLGIASFLHGSLLQPDESPEVIVPRLLGLVLLVVGALRSGDTDARRQIGLAAGLLAVAEAVTVLPNVGEVDWLADGARALGALGLGAALLTASQRSISARVAASATGTILLVVLAVSVALSTVVVDNVEEEALLRIQSRAAAEAAEIERTADDAKLSAKLAALVLSSSDSPGDTARLVTLAEDPSSDEGALAGSELRSDLGVIAEELVFQGAILAYVTSEGVVVGGVGVDSGAVQVDIAGSELVREVIAAQAGNAGGPAVIAGEAVAAAASPVSVMVGGRARFVGVVFAAEPFDPGYLALRRDSDPTLSLALVGRDGVLASSGAAPAGSVLTSAARAVLNGGEPTRRVVGGELFLAAEAVTRGTEPVFAMVVTAPTTLVAQTRQQLFQTLFLVALGAALVALVLAALVGERIGAGLRRLTQTALEIRTGNLDARAGLDTTDELGTLGEAFDSMAVALGDMTGELRAAAVDEARLRGRMEAVVAGMGEALMAIDAAGSVTDFNAAAEELFDRPSSEVCGSPISDLQLLGPQGEDLTGRLAVPRLEPWSIVATVVRRDATTVPVAVSCGAVRGPVGEIAGGVIVLRDLRPEREVERMKTEFLANISHEWKTPLTPIKGYASMLSTRPLSREKTQDFASEILVSAGKLERVISRLVNFATVSAGRLELRTESVAARELIDAARARWKDRLGEGHRFVVRVARGLPDIEGDRRYLDQVLDELIDNALKYSPRGGPVTISARAAGRAGNGSRPYVELAVSDEGVGIPPDRLGTIFGDFAQGDGSATREFGGLGLGLALVSHICDAHGGNLTCRSELGAGSTFILVLPAVRAGVPDRGRLSQPVTR